MDPLLAFVIGMVVLVLIAIKPFKMPAFIALTITALVIGILAGMSPLEAISTFTQGFGSLVTKIGLVIIFGIILGRYLEVSGAAKSMALAFLNIFKEKNAPLGMALSGYVSSIPVYSDVTFVIFTPLMKAISATARISLPVLAVSLSAGALATHVFVPPTPGPLAVAGLLNIELGKMIIYGSLAALGMTLGGWAFAVLYLQRKYPDVYPTLEEISENVSTEERLPSASRSFIALLTPMVLILLNTAGSILLPENSSLLAFLKIIGDKNIALMIGAGLAALLLKDYIGIEGLKKNVDESLRIAGPIVFITAAGGGLSSILKASGAGKAVAEGIAYAGIPPILAVFIVAGILKTATGSGTTAVITSATLATPFVEMGVPPILIALAAGSGARLVCHVNDSFFWVYTKMTGFDTEMGLKTLTIGNIFMALGGFIVTLILAAIGVR
ncbi:GntP family permease [Thermococcus aggregans]|uniref:GntP family permease n=1 Tax=Thermococcus aggregans TaxID=110163 RepID=A0A9E7MXM0_THEAG|nr:SLC13 family permease [Thermococcus aggregans]USS40669.1 GntP family permease [Thermococcus aggregans]